MNPEIDKSRSVVYKVVPILEAVVAADQDGIGVREVSRRTGIDKSAVSRLFKQLEDVYFVQQSGSSGRFQVGPRLSALAAVVRDNRSMWRVAEPLLHHLVRQFDETCYLIMREGQQVRFAERVECHQTIRYVIEQDETSPLHAGAAGRAILAGMSGEEVDQYLRTADLVPITDRTTTDPVTVRSTSRQDRRNGYAHSVGERVVEGVGVASPFFRADGRCLGALLWTCPLARFSDDVLPDVIAALTDACGVLSARLGYEGGPATPE